MMPNKGLIQSELFYAEHLNPNDVRDLSAINTFSIDAPEGKGLDIYLKEYSCNDEDSHEMRSYLVRDNETDECVGYFSLKAGLISLNETEVEIKNIKSGKKDIIREFDTLPGVELANFAVNSQYINSYPYQKGVGKVIFNKFIIPIVNTAAHYIGIKMIYIFALPYDKLITRYMNYGFQKLSAEAERDLYKRLKPRYDESCRFMYQLL